MAREERPYHSLNLPVGEVMQEDVHEGDTGFVAEMLFQLNMVKTCQLHTESTVLSIYTKPFTENKAQNLLLQHLSIRNYLSWLPFSSLPR